MGTPGTFHLMSVNFSWTSPALRTSQDNHGPTGSLCHSRLARVLLNCLYVLHTFVHRGGHSLVHCVRIAAFNEVWCIAIADEKLLDFIVIYTRKNCRVVNLVAVEM